MKIAYRIALFCGIAPLVIAALIMTGWLFTGSTDLLFYGVFNILGGIVLFIIGCCCLVIYEYQHRRQYQKSASKKLITPIVILISNFPAAALCIYSVILMNSYSTVVIDNQSQEYISSIEFTATNETVRTITGIMPLEKTKKYIRFQSSGKMYYSFELNGQIRSGVFVEYMSRQRGKNIEMVISPNGQVTVDVKASRRFGF